MTPIIFYAPLVEGEGSSGIQTPQVTWRVRLVFIGVITLLAVQSLFIRRYGEPYPALVMPGFEGSGGYHDGRLEIFSYEAVFMAEGEEFSFAPKVLLEEFPDSHHGEIASNSLMPQLITKPVIATKSQWGKLRDVIFPGYCARTTSRTSPSSIASFQNWLRARAKALVPHRPVHRVEIRWFREIIKIDGGRLESECVPQSTVVVVLDGG